MNSELKKQVKSQAKLMDILQISRMQAFRIWTGRSNLTPSNERLIKLTLGIK